VIETVNESRADREAKQVPQQQTLFDVYEGKEGDSFEEGWKNKLIWGDNLLVMGSLLEKFAGKIDLIYIDPPFATGADFSFEAGVGDSGFEVHKQQSIMEEKAYRDTWGRGADSYMTMIYDRLRLIRELLSETGSIYIHCDWHVGHSLKIVMDEIFGIDNFNNHITWKRSTPRGNAGSRYAELTDYILFYTKTSDSIWNPQYGKYREEYVEKYYGYKDEKTGRFFQPTSLLGHTGINPVRNWRGISKPWRYPPHRLDELDAAGLLYWPPKGEVPRLKRFLDEQKGTPIQSLWDDIPPVNSQAKEDTGYDTQKSEALLERVINASSNEGDLVADFFCGSGTTLALAEKLGRRWIGCDLGRWAVHVTRKRLLGIENCKPFEVLNLGKYERQYWQGVTFGERKNKHLTEQALYEYLAFILTSLAFDVEVPLS
jgi:adenine specific DNA methylase Mod